MTLHVIQIVQMVISSLSGNSFNKTFLKLLEVKI